MFRRLISIAVIGIGWLITLLVAGCASGARTEAPHALTGQTPAFAQDNAGRTVPAPFLAHQQ